MALLASPRTSKRRRSRCFRVHASRGYPKREVLVAPPRLRLDTGRELEAECLPDLEFSKRITRVEEYSKRELLEKFRKSAE